MKGALKEVESLNWTGISSVYLGACLRTHFYFFARYRSGSTRIASSPTAPPEYERFSPEFRSKVAQYLPLRAPYFPKEP